MDHGLQRLELPRDRIRTFLFGYLQITKLLKVKPKLRGGCKEARQAESRVGADGALAVHNLRNACHGDAHVLYLPILGNRRNRATGLNPDQALLPARRRRAYPSGRR